MKKRKELLGIKEREFDLTIIQVEFNFQYVLEVRFHPRETVSKLYDFVKTALDPKLLSINENFQLILPPHQVIKNYEKTFKELSMFPACTVRFYTDVPQDQYNGPYLKEEYIKNIVKDFSTIQIKDDNDNNEVKNDNDNNNKNKPKPKKRTIDLKKLIKS